MPEEEPCKVECEEPHPFAQGGPHYGLLEHCEEDPDYFLKLMTLQPPPKYVPTFLRMEEESKHKRIASELPFEPLDNIKEAIVYPIEKQVGNLAEVAETLLTLINCEPTEECKDEASSVCSNKQSCRDEPCETELMECQQSPVKETHSDINCCLEEEQCSQQQQAQPDEDLCCEEQNQEEDECEAAAESPMPKPCTEEAFEPEEMRYMNDVPVYSDEEEEGCDGGDWDSIAPPLFAVPSEIEEAHMATQEEEVFMMRSSEMPSRVRRLEDSPPTKKCEEQPAPATTQTKRVRIQEPDTPEVSFYRKRYDQARKFEDRQALGEVVFEIKCAGLEDFFDIEEAEAFIYNE